MEPHINLWTYHHLVDQPEHKYTFHSGEAKEPIGVPDTMAISNGRDLSSSPSYGNGGGWWYYNMPVDMIIRLIHAHRLTILSGTIYTTYIEMNVCPKWCIS